MHRRRQKQGVSSCCHMGLSPLLRKKADIQREETGGQGKNVQTTRRTLYLKRALFGKNGYLEWCACELPKGKCSSLQQQFQKKKQRRMEKTYQITTSEFFFCWCSFHDMIWKKNAVYLFFLLKVSNILRHSPRRLPLGTNDGNFGRIDQWSHG